MVNKYLIFLDNANLLQARSPKLIESCRLYLGNKEAISVYESFNFIDGTGYTRTVVEEIEFVLRSQEDDNKAILQIHDFIKVWKLEKYLSYNLAHLSGGWKKYLGLALFTNIRTEHKIYFDASRQLSDTLIENLIQNIEIYGIKNSFFIEWDAMLLTQMGLTNLYSAEDGFSSILIPKANESESNYE